MKIGNTKTIGGNYKGILPKVVEEEMHQQEIMVIYQVQHKTSLPQMMVQIEGLFVEELQTIRRLMTQLPLFIEPSANCTTTASVHLCISANTSGVIDSHSWIVDSGAIDHMTGPHIFSHHILQLW